MGHVFFLHLFNSHLLSSLLVNCKFDETKLPFAKSLADFIILQHIGVAHCLLEPLNPLVLLLYCSEEHQT